MKAFWILIKFEWLNFRADRGLTILTTLTLMAGIYGIYYGNTEIQRQHENIAALQVLEEYNIKELKVKYPGETDAGDIAYYHPTFAVHEPTTWASLSMGQRDVNPYYLKLRLLGIQAQLYDSENVNPQKVLTGNFDLSFVLVYLFPLLIIALCFNILSAERELGTLPLLLSQPISLPVVVGAKLLFRLLLVAGMALLLSVGAMLLAQVQPDSRVFLWLAVALLYCLFWFGVALLVAVLQKNSAFNAVLLLGVWLLLTIIIPGLLNVYVTVKQPVPQGMELTIKQREEVNAGWDKPKEEILNKFFARYPQWTDTTTIKERFVWRWYYAMHEVGDMSVEEMARDYKAGLLQRQKLVAQLNVLSVPVNVQGIFNAMAATDLPAHLAFLQSAETYHVALKKFYYPFLFNQVAFTHSDFDEEPDHTFTASPDTGTIHSGLYKLVLSVLLVFVIGILLLRRTKVSVK